MKNFNSIQYPSLHVLTTSTYKFIEHIQKLLTFPVIMHMILACIFMVILVVTSSVGLADKVAENGDSSQWQQTTIAATDQYSATESTRFLTPLKTAPTLSPHDPRVTGFCRDRSKRSQCPVFSTYSGSRGSGPFQFSNLKANSPNLRVTFLLDEVSHDVISGQGVNNMIRATWLTHSSIATLERYPFGPLIELWAPQPGETWQYGAILYDGLVDNGCVHVPPVFPVEFQNQLEEIVDQSHVLIGEFKTEDNTTLIPTGYWNFLYTIRATSVGGGVSDITVRGSVSVVCTHLEDL